MDISRMAWGLLAMLLAAGCATNPASISPAPTDHAPFMAYDCVTLTTRVDETDKELRRYISSQSNARVGDALTWPIPTSRIFGKNRRNVAAISRLSGELDALRKAQILKCGAGAAAE
jgi:hypothetical protein